jgi:hypothetical protein
MLSGRLTLKPRPPPRSTSVVAQPLRRMPHTFPDIGNPAESVGRTPWSARVPLDPLFANEISLIHAVQADGGVGCGPGGPPHNQRELCGYWEKYAALASQAAVSALMRTRFRCPGTMRPVGNAARKKSTRHASVDGEPCPRLRHQFGIKRHTAASPPAQQ